MYLLHIAYAGAFDIENVSLFRGKEICQELLKVMKVYLLMCQYWLLESYN
jgi:hypothetical protein